MKKIKLLFLCLFCLSTPVLLAQVTTSGISGTIQDEKGETLVGATILAIHTPSGTQYGTVTDEKGTYRLSNIQPGGPYSITVRMLGYSPLEVRDIYVSLGDNYNFNAKMQEESVNLETVVIKGTSSSNMRSDRAGAITNLNLKAIANAPTVSRSVNDLIRLTPQAYVSGNGANIGGGNYRQSFVTVDGAAFNNAFGIGQNLPSGGSPISLDALEQISVNVTPYDVRQSGFNGASINAVTRSGSNQFNGSAYMYYNNEAFKGNKVGDVKFDKNESKYHVYGIRLGGPIVKDKLFFFVNYEQEKSTEPGPARVASTPEHPYTDGSDNIARPTARKMEEIRDYLISKYGYDPGAYQGYSSESPGHKLLARLDWNITNQHKLSLRYTNTKIKSPSNPSTSTGGLGDRNFTANSRTAMTAMFFQNARYYQESNFSSVAGELNSRFANGKINNLLRVSYSHQDEPRSTDGGEFPFVDIAEEGNTYTSFGTELFSSGNLRDVKTTNITDEISWNLNNHNLLAGVQFEHNVTKNGFQRFGSGYYQYNSWEDFLNDKANQFAITHSFNSDYSQAFPQFKYNQLSFYLQDEINVSPCFKVSAGIRFELPMYPDLNTYNEQVANTLLGSGDYNHPTLLKQYNTTDLPRTKVMLSPRIGFNYALTSDRTLVLRGGTGLFTGRIPFVWIVSQAGDAGVLQATYVATQTNGNLIPRFTPNRQEMMAQIYPNGVTASTASLSSVSLMDRGLKMPQTWKSSLALDARLPGGIKATLEGIYNKDINPAFVTNIGLKPGIYTNIAGYADNRPCYGESYDSKLKTAYLLTNAEKSGYYYSLTTKLEKFFPFGLNTSLAYTYAKAKNVTDGVGDQIGSAWSSPANVNGANSQELGYASYVMPHRIVGSLSYRIEYLKHLATSISLFYEGGPQGRLSYTYTSNVLGDGGAKNLIYVPKTKDELSFADVTDKNGRITYSKEQQAEDFWTFVNHSDYLKTRKGKYAERNGAVYPWTHQFDLKINQDIFANIKGKRNTLQIGLDIMNVGNLLNKKWGSKQSYTESSILKQVNKLGAGSTDKPVYNFVKNGTETLNKDFTKTVGYSSTYSMQLSIRYIFN